MRTYMVECADTDCRADYDRNIRKSCPCCGETDYQDIDQYEVIEQRKNDADIFRKEKYYDAH